MRSRVLRAVEDAERSTSSAECEAICCPVSRTTKETLNVYQTFRVSFMQKLWYFMHFFDKSAKTYKNRAKNVKITRRSTVFEVFRRYFYVFTLRYANLSCLSIRRTFRVSLLSKEVGKTAPDGIRILLVTLCPDKKSCSRYRSWI